MIPFPEIKEARDRLSDHVLRTPLIKSPQLSERLGTNVYLKLEVFQRTGAFKVRGAFNKMLTLSAEERSRGVVAASGGNHAQGVALAARTLGIRAVILMPENAPRGCVEATRRHGAQVVLTRTIAEAFERVNEYVKSGLVSVHPFDDPFVIAGQGTIGLEIVEDLPGITDLFASIGGGGLISGVASAVKSLKPQVRVWGAETFGADSMSQALLRGQVVKLPRITSIAKTLGAPEVSERTLSIVRNCVEQVLVVSDNETMDALEFLLEREKILTEPAAACTLAALLRMKGRFAETDHVVLILCGGNISIEDLELFRRERQAEIA